MLNNKKKYYVSYRCSKEQVKIRAYMARNYLTAKSFVREVLKYCKNKPKFVDKAPFLLQSLEVLS